MKATDICEKITLADLAMKYCESTWLTWKTVKLGHLADEHHPFVGGPQDLLAKKISSVTKPDGTIININKLTRLRLRDLSDASLMLISEAMSKDLASIKAQRLQTAKNPNDVLGMDVCHQEFVATFKENVDNDYKHLVNNLASVSAVLDAVMSFVAVPEMGLQDFATQIDQFNTIRENAKLIAVAVRCSWLGRAAQDGSWKENSEFRWYRTLHTDVAALDPYVAVPTLNWFAADIREGRFSA